MVSDGNAVSVNFSTKYLEKDICAWLAIGCERSAFSRCFWPDMCSLANNRRVQGVLSSIFMYGKSVAMMVCRMGLDNLKKCFDCFVKSLNNLN